MNTTRFNLLPPAKRKRVSRFLTLHALRGMLTILLVALAVSSAFLGIGRQIIGPNLAAQRERTMAAEQFVLGAKRTTLSQEILALNKKLTPAKTLQNNFHAWSETLPTITNIIPGGVVLTRMTVSSETKRVTLQGTATTRTNVLAFQAALQSSALLNNVTASTTDFLQRENIPFTFSADLVLP